MKMKNDYLREKLVSDRAASCEQYHYHYHSTMRLFNRAIQYLAFVPMPMPTMVVIFLLTVVFDQEVQMTDSLMFYSLLVF